MRIGAFFGVLDLQIVLRSLAWAAAYVASVVIGVAAVVFATLWAAGA